MQSAIDQINSQSHWVKSQSYSQSFLCKGVEFSMSLVLIFSSFWFFGIDRFYYLVTLKQEEKKEYTDM